MKTFIHISDLHFCRIDASMTDDLVKAFSKINPDLIIISGDLTQRAKIKEFSAAHVFLEKLKQNNIPFFVIPGNHDIEPFYKTFFRVFAPYRRYKKFISQEIEPVYSDEEIAITSINTVRAYHIKNGGINMAQIKKAETWLASCPTSVVKIIVTHHPLDLSSLYHKLDLHLSGHYHRSSVIPTSERYNNQGYNAIGIQAGTVSLRSRGEAQSFNVIKIDTPKIEVETHLFDLVHKNFLIYKSASFEFQQNQWKRTSSSS